MAKITPETKIYVAGHRGLVGSAIWANLQKRGFTHLVGRSHSELDLTDAVAVRQFFDEEHPEAVILAAAHVGGILANNTYRADFIYDNLQIQQNVIGEAFRHGVRDLLFLGSTCIYPRDAHQPIREEELLTAPLEYTNEPYAIAKIAGLKLCESLNLQYGTNYLAVMPTNLYGIYPGRVKLWGSGSPLREFLWSEDMADASVHILLNVDFRDLCPEGKEIRNCHVNIGTGKELTIRALAELIARVTDYKGVIEWDSTKPDGTMRKLTSVEKLHSLGWHHTVEIEDGVQRLFSWYLQH